MIDYDKINEYATKMVANFNGCVRLTNVALDELFGAKNQSISETELQEGIKYLIAKIKREIEETSNATVEQKEYEKDFWETTLKLLEEQIKSDLRGQNRLI